MSFTESDLTEEQKRGIDAAANWYKQGVKEDFRKGHTFRLSGPAGSGKSTLALFAIEAMGFDPYSEEVVKVAYTGKATMVMRRKGLVDAITIHSAMYIPVDDIQNQLTKIKSEILALKASMMNLSALEKEVARKTISDLTAEANELSRSAGSETNWVKNLSGPLSKAKLCLCDEGSMVGGITQRDLESFGIPILYLGDHHQLSPIDKNESSVFFDKSGKVIPADFTLTRIHRQAEGNPIIRYSRDIREGKDVHGFFGKMTGETGETLIRVPRERITVEHLAKTDQVIVGYNNTRHYVNGVVREHLGRSGPYPEVGDKLVCLKNSREHGLVNGMMGVNRSEYYNFSSNRNTFMLDVDLEDGRTVMSLETLVPYFQYPGETEHLKAVPGWLQKVAAHFDYGFAMTCHKMQGSSVKNGIILEEPVGKTPEERRRWEYTAVTRLEKSGVIAV